MNCQQVKEALPLYYYGELAPEQEEDVEAHAAECEPCGQELRQYQRFARVLDEAELEPPLGLLSECREMLARRVTEWEQPAQARSWRQRLFAWHIDFRIPAGALALIAVGWFSARLVGPEIDRGGIAGLSSQAAVTSLVRSVEPDASGRVQIAVDDVHRRIVSGGLQDQKIRTLLFAAAREESNPGVRVESVDVLKNLASAADVRAALLESVARDPSPGVRLKALEGLKQFGQDGAVRKALTAVLLNDSDPAVRIEVIDLLTAHHDESVVGVMQNLVRKESDDYVRGRLKRALVAMNASVGTF